MIQSAKHIISIQNLFWIAIISSWLAILFFFFIPFSLLFWIGALVYLFISRAKLKWYLLLFSSWTLIPVWNFASGSKDYFQGKAAIETFGMPTGEFYNLDPELRVWNSTSGCMAYGIEPFIQVPNNLAIRFWTSLLGPQKGVYTGIYPTKEQAKELINKSECVSLSRRADAFTFNYRNVVIALQSDDYDDSYILDKTIDAKAFILNNECILIETTSDDNQPVILLADNRNGKIFARYYYYQPR